MPQDQQLDVFRELAAPVPDKQPQNSREGEIGEGKEHRPMLPKPSTCDSETRNLGFETPHVLASKGVLLRLPAHPRIVRVRDPGELSTRRLAPASKRRASSADPERAHL